MKFPNTDGVFSDINELQKWEVLGIKSSQGRAGSASLDDPTSTSTQKWKPKHYRPTTGGGERKQVGQ